MEKTKQTRTPRQYETIKTGALALEFEEKVQLRNLLTTSIDNELKALQEKAKAAADYVNGTKPV